MKKWCLILVLGLLLTGCSSAQTFETLGDIDMAPAVQQKGELIVSVPDPAEVVQGESGTLYLCRDYSLTVEVLSAGDLNGTVQKLTGFGMDDLTVISTAAGDTSRYECVWTAVGEGGDWVGRTLVLDDGKCHYCVSMQYSATEAAGMPETWQEITDSIRIG